MAYNTAYDISSAPKKPSYKLDMTPAEIARRMGPSEFVTLCTKVEDQYHQKFGVLNIQRTPSNVVVEVGLQDDTNHMITL